MDVFSREEKSKKRACDLRNDRPNPVRIEELVFKAIFVVVV
jgi:hypothetical protein